ncbi:sperm motility kinase-like [Perognathus longimembris pacificus]|uniref:sperm motility kinase-like n=1 Tax=Perognathus longimembris pacificus TaxID=214514 RepID=UPI0020190415|nr:sperm motility kinase-like [Perognathus longimembris pacificus]
MESSHSKCTTFSSPDEEALTSQYYVYHTIGSGTFGHVKKACHHLTDKEVAVKILQTRDYPILVENEVDIVKSLSHPHLIRVYQMIQGEEHVYLVIEMATKGNLQTWIQDSSCLFENEARKLLQQILSAVQYCHLNWIAHLDLKPDNILLDENGNAKVSDFGLSVRVAPGELLTEVRGAYVFCAPEIYLKQAYDGFKVDRSSSPMVLSQDQPWPALHCSSTPKSQGEMQSCKAKAESQSLPPAWPGEARPRRLPTGRPRAWACSARGSGRTDPGIPRRWSGREAVGHGLRGSRDAATRVTEASTSGHAGDRGVHLACLAAVLGPSHPGRRLVLEA